MKTFSQRLASAMVWWGIPLMALELIGIAKQYWVPVLFLALPATMVGVFVEALIEHALVKHFEQKRVDRETPGTPRRLISNS
jgi:steroid 5-alpha reductase family enzyme